MDDFKDNEKMLKDNYLRKLVNEFEQDYMPNVEQVKTQPKKTRKQEKTERLSKLKMMAAATAVAAVITGGFILNNSLTNIRQENFDKGSETYSKYLEYIETTGQPNSKEVYEKFMTEILPMLEQDNPYTGRGM